MASPPDDPLAPDPLWVVIRILHSNLVRSFTMLRSLTKMNPYAVMEWHRMDRSEPEVFKTPVDYGGHMSPIWKHIVKDQLHLSREERDRVVFKVYHVRTGGLGSPAFCGEASIGVAELFGGSSTPGILASSRQANTSFTKELALTCGGEATGTITVEVLMMPTSQLEAFGSDISRNAETSCSLTQVEPTSFEGTAIPLSVSGGTAAFYRLRLRQDCALAVGGKPVDYFIGKDLSHARDELTFYEQVLHLSRDQDGGGLYRLFPFMFDYAGCLTILAQSPRSSKRSQGKEDAQAADDIDKRASVISSLSALAPPPKSSCSVSRLLRISGRSASPSSSGGQDKVDLLVMCNLHEGSTKLRLLDIKIGQQTAAAGWQGKSRFAAMRQSLVDSNTNSKEEGFRLEGFDAPPPALVSMDPLLDVSVLNIQGRNRKRALRLMFQRMGAEAFMMHFFDLHQSFPDFEEKQLVELRAPSEYVELVHHEIVCQLTRLALACRLTPVPQKWIGSSVALGFDVGALPLRSQPDEEIRKSVRVHIFDWGRSELNTCEMHMALDKSEQKDRTQFWGYYIDGIDRLLHGALSSYWQRYGSDSRWVHADIRVYDFDSMTDNDFIGKAIVPLEEAGEKTVVLLDRSGNEVHGFMSGSSATLTYSITWREHPAGSRLRGAWCLRLVSGANFPALDFARGSSDPFAVVTAYAEDGRHFKQQSSVILGNLNPSWDEEIEIPLASSPELLTDALVVGGAYFGETVAHCLASGSAGSLATSCTASKQEKDQSFRNLTSRLDASAASSPGSRSFGTHPAGRNTARDYMRPTSSPTESFTGRQPLRRSAAG